MSMFTTVDAATDAGATSDMFTRNALACAGTGALVGVASGSVLAVAVAAPLQVGTAVLAASGCIYAGNRVADGKPVNPWSKGDKTEKTEAQPATEAAAA
jgi:hypothetical protein